VLLTGLAVWSVATASSAAAAVAAVAPVAVLAASRLLFGLASACLMPAVSATASQWVPLSRKASSISFVYACFNVGARPRTCL
jgi:MFS family permease